MYCVSLFNTLLFRLWRFFVCNHIIRLCSDEEWTDVIHVKWFCFEVKWCEVILFGSEVMWSDVEWTNVIYVKLFCYQGKRSEVSYVEVLEDKSTIHIGVTLYCGYLIVLWLFYLECILYCGCFNLLCNVWLCVRVGFVMSGCV